MKKYFKICTVALLVASMVIIPHKSHAIIWEVVKAAIVKAIKAADLAIQRQQNKVIWLQNAQKTLENTMSKLKLKEISDWSEKQRKQYADYFEELKKVRNTISTYKKVRDIMSRQLMLVEEYKRAWNLLKQDKHFSAKELDYMYKVYSGILEESLKNLDQMLLVTTSFNTQMSDGKRLELIHNASKNLEKNITDLRKFNHQNASLSFSRASDQHEAQLIKKWYGLK